MSQKPKSFSEIKQGAEAFYGSITKVWCPYLKKHVHFNREGWEHLLFKSWNKTRSQHEQMTRLRLLFLVPGIINKSDTLQEYDHRSLFVRQKVHSRWEKPLKEVRYFVFIAIVGTVRMKAVVKWIEGGEPFFYSLYPSWREMKNKDGSKKKIFYIKDPEHKQKKHLSAVYI